MREGRHFCDVCSAGKVFPFQNQNFQVGTKNTRHVTPTSGCPSCSSSDICSGERSGKVLQEEHLSAALKIGKGNPGSCLPEKMLLCLTWLVSFGHKSHLSRCSSCWQPYDLGQAAYSVWMSICNLEIKPLLAQPPSQGKCDLWCLQGCEGTACALVISLN